MISTIKRFYGDESGATAIEYGLIAAGIAVVVIVGVQLIGTSLQETFLTIGEDLGGTRPE